VKVAVAVAAAGVVGFVAGGRSLPATILSTYDASVAPRRVATLGADPALSEDPPPPRTSCPRRCPT